MFHVNNKSIHKQILLSPIVNSLVEEIPLLRGDNKNYDQSNWYNLTYKLVNIINDTQMDIESNINNPYDRADNKESDTPDEQPGNQTERPNGGKNMFEELGNKITEPLWFSTLGKVILNKSVSGDISDNPNIVNKLPDKIIKYVQKNREKREREWAKEILKSNNQTGGGHIMEKDDIINDQPLINELNKIHLLSKFNKNTFVQKGGGPEEDGQILSNHLEKIFERRHDFGEELTKRGLEKAKVFDILGMNKSYKEINYNSEYNKDINTSTKNDINMDNRDYERSPRIKGGVLDTDINNIIMEDFLTKGGWEGHIMREFIYNEGNSEKISSNSEHLYVKEFSIEDSAWENNIRSFIQGYFPIDDYNYILDTTAMWAGGTVGEGSSKIDFANKFFKNGILYKNNHDSNKNNDNYFSQQSFAGWWDPHNVVGISEKGSNNMGRVISKMENEEQKRTFKNMEKNIWKKWAEHNSIFRNITKEYLTFEFAHTDEGYRFTINDKSVFSMTTYFTKGMDIFSVGRQDEPGVTNAIKLCFDYLEIIKEDSAKATKDEMARFLNKNGPGFSRKIFQLLSMLVNVAYYPPKALEHLNIKQHVINFIIILFDLKKSGDWGQVEYIQTYNNQEKNEIICNNEGLPNFKKKLFLVSSNALCILKTYL